MVHVRPSFQSGYSPQRDAHYATRKYLQPASGPFWTERDAVRTHGNVCGDDPPVRLPADGQGDGEIRYAERFQQPYVSGSPLTPTSSESTSPHLSQHLASSIPMRVESMWRAAARGDHERDHVHANVADGSSNPSGQVFTIAQTTSSTTGAPVVSPTGSTTCTYRSWNNTTKCTQNYQQVTTTTTPTTFTTVTVDQVAAATTVSAYTSNANATVTANASSSCTVSGTGSCSPSQPSSFSGGTEVDSTTNGAASTLS